MISDVAQTINIVHGFDQNVKSTKRCFALIMSECAEMLEADRKDRWSKNIIAELVKRKDNLIEGMTLEQAHQFIDCLSEDSAETFDSWFQSVVKDTVEDELADVVIRICSYLASCNYKMQFDIDTDQQIGYYSYSYAMQDISENIFDFMASLTIAYSSESRCEELEKIAHSCYVFAHFVDIDLRWHVKMKLKYNGNRPYKHGKKY